MREMMDLLSVVPSANLAAVHGQMPVPSFPPDAGYEADTRLRSSFQGGSGYATYPTMHCLCRCAYACVASHHIIEVLLSHIWGLRLSNGASGPI